MFQKIYLPQRTIHLNLHILNQQNIFLYCVTLQDPRGLPACVWCGMLFMTAFCYENWSNQAGFPGSICIASGSHWHVDNCPKNTSCGEGKIECWIILWQLSILSVLMTLSGLLPRIQITMLPVSFICWHIGVLSLYFDDGSKCKNKSWVLESDTLAFCQ